MTPLKWIWLRHARPLVERGYIYGAEETVPLNLTGPETLRAFHAIAGVLPENAHIECSTSPRAQISLDQILKIKTKGLENYPALHLNANFLEQSFGDWIGKNQSDLTPEETADYKRDLDRFGPPNGESGNAFQARVSAEIDHINQRYKDGDIRSPAIFVSAHGGVIRAALAKAWQIPFSKATAQRVQRLSITEIQWDPNNADRPWHVDAINRTLSSDV